MRGCVIVLEYSAGTHGLQCRDDLRRHDFIPVLHAGNIASNIRYSGVLLCRWKPAHTITELPPYLSCSWTQTSMKRSPGRLQARMRPSQEDRVNRDSSVKSTLPYCRLFQRRWFWQNTILARRERGVRGTRTTDLQTIILLREYFDRTIFFLLG